MINKSTALKAKFWFTSDIDIENGNLWINKDMNINKISFAEEQAFSKFVNKMITGNENYPKDWIIFFNKKLKLPSFLDFKI